MHLIIDGHGGDARRLASLEFIYGLLDRYPAKVGMVKIAPPYVFRYVGSKPEDWGISGFVLIAESHISIHTFPERAYINIDIFSCKGFDAAGAIADLKQEFRLSRLQTKVLQRGLEYPDDVASAATIVEEERLRISPAGRHG